MNNSSAANRKNYVSAINRGTSWRRQETIRSFPIIVLVGMCASVLMYWITAQGPGVSPDSITYIEAAQSLLKGNGLFVQGKAMTHYPPAYPFLLSAVGLVTHGDILLAARLLAALLFGVNFVLLALAVHVCTRHSWVSTSCAMLIFLFSAPVISVHSMAWSEAPFITFSMVGLLLLAHHIARPSPYLLILASLMVGFAAATRYVGIILFPTVALAAVLLGKRSFKYKMRDILVFSIIACAPLVSWLIRNILIAQSATNREFVFHPFSLNHAKDLIVSMYSFVLPISISGWAMALHVGVAVTLFVLSCTMLFRKMYIKQNATSVAIVLPSIYVIYSSLYIVFLVVSVSFLDAYTPVDHRILLPVFLSLTVVGLSVAKSLSEALTQRFIWYGFVLFVLFSVSINATHVISRAVDINHNGSGYTSRYWKDSEILAYLSDVPDIIKIYSNGPDVTRFLAGMDAVGIPAKVFPTTHKENEEYQEQLNQMIRECEEGNALIVYFDTITWRWYLPTKEEIESMGNLPFADRLKDGVIYGVPVVKSKAEQGAALDGNSATLHPRQ